MSFEQSARNLATLQGVRRDLLGLLQAVVVAVAVWTLVVGVILGWSLHQEREAHDTLVLDTAQASFSRDRALIGWASGHGGVYVPIDADGGPSPYLDHVPTRDLLPEDGPALTLLDPATMMRRIGESYPDHHGVTARIVSLEPLNPDNRADRWEEAALAAFARGEDEAHEVVDGPHGPVLRLMRPMRTEPQCLACHGHQGFMVGDIQGGFGVALPLAGYRQALTRSEWRIAASHAGMWLLGLTAIGWTGSRWRARLVERDQASQKLEEMATRDALTGLPNRALFLEHLDLACAQADRDDRLTAIHFIDLDSFKDVNDTEGHALGDRLLAEVSSRLRILVRRSDTVARLGGDEFAVIQPSIQTAADADILAEKLLEAMKRPFVIEGKELLIGASIGITIYPIDDQGTEELVRNADIAMYEAKNAGRNRHQFYSPDMSRSIIDRREMERDLRRAVAENEFELYLQPRLLTASGEIVSAEALIRWQHPERGIISPGVFIPVAEKSHLILDIGVWVLREACDKARSWQDKGMRPIGVSVNLSAAQFRRANVVGLVRDALATSDLDAKYLEIEITEGTAMEDVARTQKILDELSRLGVRLSLDDFGTGYSSLAYLKRFPLDHLKIDKSFVDGVLDDPNDQAIVDTVIALAHTLGMAVTAEGVEQEGQLDYLTRLGCEEVQGFLFSPPLPAPRFEEILRAQTANLKLQIRA